MRFDAFTAGFYSFPSLDAASQLTMNYYPDLVEGSMPKMQNPAGAEKARMVLTPTPGWSWYATMPAWPTTCLWAGENRLFSISGGHLYEVKGPATFQDYGSVGGSTTTPSQIFSDGGQLFTVNNGVCYVTVGLAVQQCQFSTQLYDLVIDATTQGLTGDTGGIFDATDVGKQVQITGGGTGFTVQTQTITSVVAGEAFAALSWGTPGATMGLGIEWLGEFVPASAGAFLDGTFFATLPGTNQVYYSALNDGTSWDPLSFFSKEAYPDSVGAIFADHEQLYLFGTLQSTEVWGSTGQAINPFARNPNYMIHYGCLAPSSVVRLATGVAWIGGDVSRGTRVAYLATGYVPQRVSTAAVEKAWNGYTTTDDAIAYSIIMDGHEFWVITFIAGNATWVYDVQLNEWHQRGSWNGAGWDGQRVRYHACIGIDTIADVHYVADYASTSLYIMSRSYATENGTAIHRKRRAPHMSNENKRRFYGRIEIDCDTAEADIDQAPPRVFWLRLGASRDRIFEIDDDGVGHLTLSYSDDRFLTSIARTPIAVAPAAAAITLVAAYLEFTEGTG